MVWAALGKTLLKGKAKKIAKDKLLNRKKKTNKRRMSVKKIMGMDDKPKKGGALAVRPTMDLGGNIKDFDPVSDTSGESDIIIIRKQVIQVRDILKDSYSAKKEKRDDERKERQRVKRQTREEKLEKPKVKPKESKGMKMPKPALGIGNFLSWLVFGLVVNKLLELMPQLRKIFNWLKPIINFISGIFKATIGFVVGFIDASYGGVAKLREGIVAIGGEGAGELFDKFAKLFTQFMNGALIAAMIGVRVGLFNPFRRKPKIKQPTRSFRNRIRRRRNLNKRLFDSRRTEKLRRVKNIRKLRADKLKRVKKFGRLRRLARFKNFGKNILNFKNLKNLKNLRGFGIGMVADMGVDRLFPNQAQNVANLQSRVSKNLKNFKPGQTLKNVGEGVTDVASKAKNVAKTTAKNLSTAAKTTTKNLSTTAKKLTPAVKSAVKTATPVVKSALKTATPVLKAGAKSGLKAVSGTLSAAKKIISPIVKKIPFIGALIDFALNYFVFKEPLGRSAFMAIGAGLGAWIGGAIGTLIPVPFVGTAIGSFLGGVGGDKLGGFIYDGVFGNKENKKDASTLEKDGVEDKIKEEKTLTNRFDIETGKSYINNEEVSANEYNEYLELSPEERLDKYGILKGHSENILPNDTQSKAEGLNILPNDTQNKAEGLDTHPSYAQGGMMVVDNTTTYIQPIEV